MGIYIKEFCPIKGAKGDLILTFHIEQSSRRIRTVHFEVYDYHGVWKVYWNYGLNPGDWNPLIEKLGWQHVKFSECLENEKYLSEIIKLSTTYSLLLTESEIDLINSMEREILPNLKGEMPRGLDGHHYELKFERTETEYRIGSLLPKNWIDIITLIVLFMDKAELSDDYIFREIWERSEPYY